MASALTSGTAADRTEIAFFDLETSAPQRCALLEFGAILVCPRTLVEVASFSTFVRPDDLDTAVPVNTTRYNGIAHETIAGAPPFSDVADVIYGILHGRVWAGHNIMGFDAKIIWKAFADIGRPPPEPKGVIDTLHLLCQRFGRRAGDMKMASLANYFGLGRQSHRSLDDVRMNIQILKCCSTVLLLEASPLEVLDATTWMDASSRGYSGFFELDDVSTECIRISVAPLHQFGCRAVILHKDTPLQLCCGELEVQFGVSTKFVDNAGRPKLNIVVEIPENLSKVLELCDDLAHVSCQESGSTSEWRPLIKKNGYWNRPTVRLNIPTIVNGDSSIYATDICQKDPTGSTQKLDFSKVDASELDSLFVRGTKVDSFFSLEIYDYQQNAGVRLVANRLVVHSK